MAEEVAADARRGGRSRRARQKPGYATVFAPHPEGSAVCRGRGCAVRCGRYVGLSRVQQEKGSSRKEMRCSEQEQQDRHGRRRKEGRQVVASRGMGREGQEG